MKHFLCSREELVDRILRVAEVLQQFDIQVQKVKKLRGDIEKGDDTEKNLISLQYGLQECIYSIHKASSKLTALEFGIKNILISLGIFPLKISQESNNK